MAGRRRALANDDPRLTPFARTLRELIDARQLSDTRLCELAGLPPSTLSRWITYTRRPTNVALLLGTAAAMKLTREEAEELMSKAGYDLDAVLRYRGQDPRVARVATIWRQPMYMMGDGTGDGDESE